jgi:hypothetical protein
MVNGLGIGACDSRRPGTRFERAPYSAIGPGRDGLRSQPIGVAFGGVLPDVPFIALDRLGRLGEVQGTSLAAPLAIRGIAELAGGLGDERSTPDLLRAFGVHFAERPKRADQVTELGFGRFRETYADTWECPPNECTVLYEAEVDRTGVTALRFPVPKGLPPDVRLDLRWTLSFLSEVDPKDTVDYTLCGLDMTFRPNERLHSLRDAETKDEVERVHLDDDRDKIARRIASGRYTLSDNPVAYSNWRKYRTESERRDAGKWETVWHGRIRKEAGELVEPRLDVAYLHRRDGMLVTEGVDPLRVVLLLTMRAPSGVALYDSVRSQFRVLAPVVRVAVPVRTAG